MIKRTIYIGNPSYLKLKQKQLVVQEPESKEIKGTIPIEDIALLMLDHYQITISNQLLIKLQGNNVAVITCDEHHLPFGLMLPLYGHSEYSERIKYQLAASEPLKKQLWKQTVEQKIENQKALLKLYHKVSEPLSEYQQNVKSGDTTNREGMAAQYYWKHLFENFSRDRFGEEPNNLLNFGYAVLRSIVARALVSSGMLPVLGIFHRNKYNAYCLADDIMEPYRPFVDKLVYNYIHTNYQDNFELTKSGKAHILTIATQDVFIDGVVRPLFIAVTTTTASLYKCFTGELRHIKYPELD
jgi:CRISPR-associated protein Cas1